MTILQESNDKPIFHGDDTSELDAVSELTQRYTDEKPQDDEEEDEATSAEGEEEEESTTEEEDEGESEDDGEESSTEEDDEGESEDEESESPKVADDEAEVSVRIGDDEHRVKVKDLKRLYGQEAALTRKSQALAEERKQAAEQSKYHAATLQRLYEKAQERLKPYQQIDWAQAAQQLDQQSYESLKQEAEAAHRDMQYLDQEARQLVEESQKRQREYLQQEAKKAREVLQDAIPEWGNKLYDEIREYATNTAGMSKDVVDNLVDPAAIQIIYKSMLYDRGQQQATSKLTQAKRKPQPKKQLKRKGSSSSKSKTSKTRDIETRLAQSGSEEDAVAALLNQWGA